MLNPKSSSDYLFVVDTSSYAGNFQRSLFSFVTGMSDEAGGDPESLDEAILGREALGLDPERLDGPNPMFDNLLELRIDDPGDDGYRRRYCALVTTPGLFLLNGEIVEEASLEGLKGHPAYASLGFFLKRVPTPSELQYMKERVKLWIKTPAPEERPWETRPALRGFRLLWCQHAWSETAL